MATFRSTTNIFFFTATNLNWVHILKDDFHKNIIIESLRFLCDDKRAKVLGFVIMPNHIHLIWQILEPHKRWNVQRDFLKYTAQQIKFNLHENDSSLLDDILVRSRDRMCQIWERNSLSFELDNPKTLIQKLNYIHNNPLQEKWNLSSSPEEYMFSSAKFYEKGADDFGFITHFSEVM
jgi:REP element-mobilizing transposase RayT